METPRLDPLIRAYYELGKEHSRLQTLAPLEGERTRDILGRVLPPAPARVLDVGGGAGVHAFWLAGLGYEVLLIDPMELHIEQAREATESGQGSLAGAEVGDARSLAVEEASADAVLLLGPLYHLIEPADRALALSEALRVLRPGGVLAAAAISRFAGILDGFAGGAIDDPDFERMARGDLADGVHRNPTSHPGWFTTAYFHHPDELGEEIAAAGFEAVDLLAVEGPAGWIEGLEERLLDEGRREVLLDLLRETEREPSLLGSSAHLIGIGRKPQRPD